MVTYLIAYFIVNFILAGMMIRNVYYIPHEPDVEKEMKEEISFYLPVMILFGTILIVMEYVFRTMEGE